MRRRTLLFSFALLLGAVPLIHCVGDEPATGQGDAGSQGDSSTGSDGSSSSDAATDGAIDPCLGSINCPSQQAAANLQLWLRGDLGVDCVGGRVKTWHDQSGHGRDAHSEIYPDAGASFGPQCGGSSFNGHSTLAFTASTGALAPFVDGTLDVDLSFLVGKHYTIFVVHEADAPTNGQFGEGLLAAVWQYPMGTSCLLNPPNNDGTLDLYLATADDGGTVLEYNAHQNCHYAGIQSNAFAYTAGAPTVSTFIFDGSHTIYADGELVYSGTAESDDAVGILGDAGDLTNAVIGRESDDGIYSGFDYRYSGQIAEIIVYDTALASELPRLNDYFKSIWNLN